MFTALANNPKICKRCALSYREPIAVQSEGLARRVCIVIAFPVRGKVPTPESPQFPSTYGFKKDLEWAFEMSCSFDFFKAIAFDNIFSF